MRTITLGAAGVAAALIVSLAGCSGDKVAQAVAAMNTSNIQRLSNLYAAHQNYKGGRGPRDEAQFKAFVRGFDRDKLQMMGVDTTNPEGVFTSERDGKPFVVRYGVGGGRGSVDAVVFEQEGQGGRRQVGFTGGKVEEADEATYQELMAGKGPSQPAAGTPTPGGPPKASAPVGRPAGAPTGPPQGK